MNLSTIGTMRMQEEGPGGYPCYDFVGYWALIAGCIARDDPAEQTCGATYRPPRLTQERQAAIDHAIEVMAQGLSWGAALRGFTRDEMHEHA
jgi:hypothetical protein